MSYKDALENRLTHIVMCTKSSGVCVQIPLGGGGGGGWRSEECPMGGVGGSCLLNITRFSSIPSDGIGRTGTFCAAYSMMDRVKVEQVVDAFQTIKSMRIQRAGLLDSLVCCGRGLLCLCFPSQLCHHMFRKHCCICRISCTLI